MPIAQIGSDMTQTLTRPIQAAAEPEPFVMKFKPLTHMNDDMFAEFSALNDDLRIERTAEGEIILMLPTHGDTGHRNHPKHNPTFSSTANYI